MLAIGEILWDIFPDGSQLGGAALNFALHAGALGADVRIVSRIGVDALGARALEELAVREVGLELVQADPAHETGTAYVGRDANGDPAFRLADPAAWDFIEAEPEALRAAAEADAVYFGSLAQRHVESRQAIRGVLDASRPEALRIFDANLRPPFVDREVIETSLRLATVLKTNETELEYLGAMFGIGEAEFPKVAVSLAERFHLDTVACTLGGKGSFFYHRGRFENNAPSDVAVVNTVGAGDSFTAALTVGLLADAPIDLIGRHANEVAAYVCTQPGAAPVLPLQLRRGLRANKAGGEVVKSI